MSYQDDDYPTRTIRDAVNELLRRNSYTQGAEVAELYLGRRGLFARFKHPVIIDGTCKSVDRTADLFDLMDEHARGL